MVFTNKNIKIYNIIFHIINFCMKVLIQQTFGFYINYYDVNINNVYHLFILKIITNIQKKYNNFF